MPVQAATGIFPTLIAPLLGSTLSNIMWATPLMQVWEAKKNKSIGVVNPFPFIIGCFCTSGWLLYGTLYGDGFIIWANFPGLTILTYCTLNLYNLMQLQIIRDETCLLSYTTLDKDKDSTTTLAHAAHVVEGGGPQRLRSESNVSEIDEMAKAVLALESAKKIVFWVETALWSSPLMWGILTYLSWVIWKANDHQTAKDTVGWICVSVTLVFFFSPLSALKEVVRVKDASSLYPPSIFANSLNCAMWFIYGWLVLRDPIVWAPNLLGLILQAINTCLVIIYGRKLASTPSEVNANNLALKDIYPEIKNSTENMVNTITNVPTTASITATAAFADFC